MKINKLKINSYGKLKEKEINLKEGINIIYGKNEAGKSTLLNFITNMFYGISKNKKGKEFSDFEKFLPWTGEEFSGKLEYELNNNKKYEIYRDFNKKNPKIFNEDMEDISKEFNIDKTKGNEFFYEQTKVDEDLFLSTILVNQSQVKLENKEQNMLIQKIANLVGTGEDNVSYKKGLDRINKRQLDEVGTSKSREKPINVVQRNLQNLEQEKEELEKYEDLKYEMQENKNKLKKEINNLNIENNLLLEIKLINEKEKIEKEKINIQENIKKENNEKIKIIKNNNKNIFENKNSEKTKKEKNKIKKLNKKIILFFILIILINILQFIFIKNKIFNYIFLLTVPTVLIFGIYFKNKSNKKIEEDEKIEKNKLNNLNQEIKIIEKNNLEIENKINDLKNNLNLKINLEKEKIKNKYLEKIEKNKLNNLINLENINLEIENMQKNINNKNIELHKLELDEKNIEPKLDNLAKIEEELASNKNKMVTLEKMNLSFNLAKTVLEKAYNEMKNSVTPKFTEELSKNISNITSGKYKNVKTNDEEGLIVELENGNYVPASKLSIGTIDQLYLSLRLSMLDEISKENMPIILDEAFAYFDSERLKNILLFLNDKRKNHQILIFTCTNREKEILEKENIEFNFIKL